MNPSENASQSSMMQNFDPKTQNNLIIEEKKQSSLWSQFLPSFIINPLKSINFSATHETNKQVNYFPNSENSPTSFTSQLERDLFKMKAITLLNINQLISFKGILDKAPINSVLCTEDKRSFVILSQTLQMCTRKVHIEVKFERVNGKPIPISFNLNKTNS